MKKYLGILEKIKGKRILVLGDIILDEYLYGETERISREAPVLILRHNRSAYLAGGGANPVMNIKALGGIPVPVSVAGVDSHSAILLKLLKEKKVDTSGIITDSNYSVPVKARIMAGSVHTVKQQIVRIDRSYQDGLSAKIESKVAALIRKLVKSKKVDAILVSDYGEGVITDGIIQVVNEIAKAGKKVIVDSRYSLDKFRSISAATPNETEAGPLVGIEKYTDENVKKIGKQLSGLMRAKGLIITRGSKGMMVFDKTKVSRIAAVGTEEIVDVSGAGDTVSSIVALCLAAGASLYDAAYLANAGGGIVVMERGVAVVTPKQLKEALKNAETD